MTETMAEPPATTSRPTIRPIWPDVAPGSEGWTHDEHEWTSPEHGGVTRVRNVVTPTLTPVLPDPRTATGAAMIIAPGGGFQMLDWQLEGTDLAAWLAARGVACFLLRYRLNYSGSTLEDFTRGFEELLALLLRDTGRVPQVTDPRQFAPEVFPLAAADGARAMSVLREEAPAFGLDPRRIGFLGFSAGAHVATSVATHADPGVRPDVVAAIYGGSVDGGVPSDAPPLFALTAANDPVAFDATMGTFTAWRAAGRPADLHVYAEGGHGFGTREQGLPCDTWTDRLAEWLAHHGFLS